MQKKIDLLGKERILFNQKNILSFVLILIILLACSESSETTGVTGTGNNISVSVVSSEVESNKIYLYSEDSPFIALDSAIGKASATFITKDTTLHYRISVFNQKQGALSETLTSKDSISLQLKNYDIESAILIPKSQKLLTVKAAYGAPVIKTDKKDEYLIPFLRSTILLEFKTTTGTSNYSVQKKENLFFKPLSPKDSLNFEIVANVFDHSLWKQHYDIQNWDNTQSIIPDLIENNSLQFSTPLTNEQASVLGRERQVLNFDIDAYAYAALPVDPKLFSVSILFKTTSNEYAGIFQLVTQEDQIVDGSGLWSLYIRDNKLKLVGLNEKHIGTSFTIDDTLYKIGEWNSIVLQFSKEQNLQLWINGALAATGKNQKEMSPVATYFNIGYVNDLNQFGKISSPSYTGYFRGKLAAISFYNRILSKSEILDLNL